MLQAGLEEINYSHIAKAGNKVEAGKPYNLHQKHVASI